jgi:hypothetical protein
MGGWHREHAIDTRVVRNGVRSNNMRCLQQVANEEHASLEAFFQNPTEQDALVQAMNVCSR